MGRTKTQAPTCTGPGCNRPSYARSLCMSHYKQWQRDEQGVRELRSDEELVQVATRITKQQERALRKKAKAAKVTMYRLLTDLVSAFADAK
mgnify:CR=1 FL=1